MKFISIILTVIIHLMVVIKLKLLDNFNVIFGIILATLIISLITMLLTKKSDNHLSKIFSGVFYGSMISTTSILIFTLWLYYNFPK